MCLFIYLGFFYWPGGLWFLTPLCNEAICKYAAELFTKHSLSGFWNKNYLRCPRALAGDTPHTICFSVMDYNSKHDTTYSTLWSLINCQKCIVEGMMDYTKENINEAHSRQPTWRPQLMSLAAWRVCSFCFPKPQAGRTSTACQSYPIKNPLDAPFSFTVMIKVIFVVASS